LFAKALSEKSSCKYGFDSILPSRMPRKIAPGLHREHSTVDKRRSVNKTLSITMLHNYSWRFKNRSGHANVTSTQPKTTTPLSAIGNFSSNFQASCRTVAAAAALWKIRVVGLVALRLSYAGSFKRNW
jgi:hypothetical protein